MENHLRAHRRRCGLSQRALAELVGYMREWQISRQERSEALPPLRIALAYEVIFEIPAHKLFRGLHVTVMKEVGHKISRMRQELAGSPADRSTKVARRKLLWLNQHKAR